MEPGDGHRSARTAITAVADALTAHGFAARAEARGDDLAIVSECCPFGEAAQQYPHVVCAVDRGMIRGMLAGLSGDVDPRLEESRPEGAEHCVTRV
jgi:predicted ArsR family transcriptional regulator